MSQEEWSIFREVTVSGILSKKVYVYMCPIPNGFGDRAISLYSTLFVNQIYLFIFFLSTSLQLAAHETTHINVTFLYGFIIQP
jgi:hypothetical protein